MIQDDAYEGKSDDDATLELKEVDHITRTLAEVERIWRKWPNYRLGQVICQALPHGIATNEIYYMRDDRLLQDIRRKLEPKV